MAKPNHKTKSFGDVDYWLSEWLKSSRRNSPNTAQAYKTDLRQFFEACGKPFDQVTVADILEYQSSLSGQFSLRTAARKLASVRSFYRFLCNREVVAMNLARIEVPKIQQRVERDKLLTEKEVKAIIDAATDDNHRLFVRFLYLTAARISEALALRWRDFDLLTTDDSTAHIIGKGGKHRDVLIPAPLWQDILKHCFYKADDDLVFSFIKNRLHALRVVKGLAKVAKIDKPVTPHSFRHAHISHALKNGATLAELRDQAGHANISTTSLYAHADRTRATATRLKVQ